MLARQLHLSPNVAAELFRTMVADGVLKAPGAAGVARAAQPMDATGMGRGFGTRIRAHIDHALNHHVTPKTQSHDAPLANTDDLSLGCDDTVIEDQKDASPHQFVQESPARG